MDMKIETQSELTRGMTVADKRTWGDKKCPRADSRARHDSIKRSCRLYLWFSLRKSVLIREKPILRL